MPYEIEVRNHLMAYGANATNKPMRLRHLRAMNIAANVVTAYRNRAASDDWAGWAAAHPDENRILIEAMKAAKNG